MNTKSIGDDAETAVCSVLSKMGWRILDRNWKNRLCEIDIIALNDNCLYFVEVKYRRTNYQGSGLDYITRTKQKQMQFAAEAWVQQHKWDSDYSLAAIEVSGANFDVGELITDF